MNMTEKEKKMYGQYLQDGGKESLLNDINKAKAKREEGRRIMKKECFLCFKNVPTYKGEVVKIEILDADGKTFVCNKCLKKHKI